MKTLAIFTSLTHKTVFAISIVALLLGGSFAYMYVSNATRELEQDTKNDINLKSQLAAKRVAGEFDILITRATNLGMMFDNAIETRHTSREAMSAFIKALVKKEPAIYS